MRRIPQNDYLALLESATILERDAHGAKLVALPGGDYVKIFRRKHWLSSALFSPYARRFVTNASRLSLLGVPTVTVFDTAYCPGCARHLVTYRPLPGTSLRGYLRETPQGRDPVIGRVAQFVAGLHDLGVYFRSLHFGNIIVSPCGSSLGLIDIADMTVGRGPLGISRRLRNARHLLRYREDAGYLHDFGLQRFVEHYLAGTAMQPSRKPQFAARLTETIAGAVEKRTSASAP